MRMASCLLLVLLVGVLALGPASARAKRAAHAVPPAHAAPAPAVAAPKPAEAKQPPKLIVDPTKLPGEEIFTAEYTCADRTKGAGCSAGCASASFSPLLYLTVVLLSVRPLDGGQPHTMYYYLVQFPEAAKNKKPDGSTGGQSEDGENVQPEAAKDGKQDPPKFKQPRATGFTLDTSAVCGSVNMDVEFTKGGQPVHSGS
jgi:hypothetical protein